LANLNQRVTYIAARATLFWVRRARISWPLLKLLYCCFQTAGMSRSG
jgi:hypothetical protein